MNIFLDGRTEIQILQLCLQEDPSVFSTPHIRARALEDANLGVIQSLLRSGANLPKTEIDATNALHIASRRGNQDLVKILLDLGADANSRSSKDERGRTPLYEALMNDGSGNPDHRRTCVDHARSSSSLDMIELLLDHGADPNAMQEGEETVLHKAVGLGEAYVRLLLSHGADVEARNDRQQSILDLTVDALDSSIDALVEYGVNLEARDANGQTAFLKVVGKRRDTRAGVEMLIGLGVDVHAKDNREQTVLHLYFRPHGDYRRSHKYYRGSSDGTLRRLLELGVDVNAKDQSGKTALVLAVENTDKPQFNLLLDFGAFFGAERKPSSTRAAAHRNIELVNSLLRMGQDPNLLKTANRVPAELSGLETRRLEKL